MRNLALPEKGDRLDNFRGQQGWLKAGMIIAAMTLLMPASSTAQQSGFIYISPGVQLTYSRDQGFAFSAQATLGLFIELPAVILPIPGITLGSR